MSCFGLFISQKCSANVQRVRLYFSEDDVAVKSERHAKECGQSLRYNHWKFSSSWKSCFKMKHYVIKGKLCSVVKMHYCDRILFSKPTEILHHILVFTDGQFSLTANSSHFTSINWFENICNKMYRNLHDREHYLIFNQWVLHW